MGKKKDAKKEAKKADKAPKVTVHELDMSGGSAGMLAALLGARMAQHAGQWWEEFTPEDCLKLDAAGYVDGHESVCEMNNALRLLGGESMMTFELLAHMAIRHKIVPAAKAALGMVDALRWANDYKNTVEGIIGHPLCDGKDHNELFEKKIGDAVKKLMPVANGKDKAKSAVMH